MKEIKIYGILKNVFLLSIPILCQNFCCLGPNIFEFPQPNWYCPCLLQLAGKARTHGERENLFSIFPRALKNGDAYCLACPLDSAPGLWFFLEGPWILKAFVSKEILNWHCLSLSPNADLCFHFLLTKSAGASKSQKNYSKFSTKTMNLSIKNLFRYSSLNIPNWVERSLASTP